MSVTQREIEAIADLVAIKVSMRIETYIAAQEQRCIAHSTQTQELRDTVYGLGGSQGLEIAVKENADTLRFVKGISSTAFAISLGIFATWIWGQLTK